MILTITLNPSVDRLIYVDKLAPYDTNRIRRIEEDAGGKGVSVARVLRRLGVDVTATGFLGGDSGAYVSSVLKSEGIISDFVHVDGDTRTNFGVQDADGSPPTALNARGPEISQKNLSEIVARVRELAHGCSFVAIGGSLPPGVPEDFYQTLIKISREQGARVALDADGAVLAHGVEMKPYMIKPNENEVDRLIGRDVSTIDEAAEAARCLHEEEGIGFAVVSMGAKGAVAASEDGVYLAVPPEVKTVSTIGSGDSMVAGILSVLSTGGPAGEAMRMGTAAGAATAMTDGTDIASPDTIMELAPQVEVRKLG